MSARINELPPNSGLPYPLDDFVPCFQPIIDVASGNVAGYESLARRKVSATELVTAGAIFFNDAIDVTTKITIDRFLRQQSMQYFSGCLSAGFLSVNIAPDWVDRLGPGSAIPTLDMIRESGIDPTRVVIEFTESSGEIEKLKKLTKIYQDAGLRVAIDDFGVGGSQIDRIIALRPDIIKLDKDLFRKASRGGPEADVLLSTASIAQRAGCKIVCEGVETEEEFHFALDCGADFIQGWLFQAAERDCVDPSAFFAQVSDLKASYIRRKSCRHILIARHNRDVAKAVKQVCDLVDSALISTDSLSPATLKKCDSLGILRFYICDLSGRQLSPNYEISGSALQVDQGFVGYNWSHRPYFPLLHAMFRFNTGHVVVSNPYRDAALGEMCKTLGVFLPGNRVLLADVLVRDEVLFTVDEYAPD